MPAVTNPSRIAQIIEEMDRDPALADALRQRILGQEFAEAIQSMLGSNTEMMRRQAELGETVRDAMKAVTESVEEMTHVAQGMSMDLGRLEERTQRTESEVQDGRRRTEEQLNTLQGAVDNVAGPTYEMKVAGNIRSLLRQHLNLRNARMLKGPNREPDREFADSLDRGRDAELITEEGKGAPHPDPEQERMRSAAEGQIATRPVSEESALHSAPEELNAVFLLDIIAQVTGQDGQLQHVAMEISITVNEHDVTRAQDRAGAIQAATGTPAVPVVVGASANERATAMIAEGRARMVRYPAG